MLVNETLDACILDELPHEVIGDKAYDSYKLDEQFAQERGVDSIGPPRSESQQAGDPRRPIAERLSPPLEGRTALCLAARLSPTGCPL